MLNKILQIDSRLHSREKTIDDSAESRTVINTLKDDVGVVRTDFNRALEGIDIAADENE